MLRVRKLHPSACLPSYGTAGAAGVDFCCVEGAFITPNSAFRIRTGVSVELPPGHFGYVTLRSGWGAMGLVALGGIIDNDYRGEIIICGFNLSNLSIPISVGMRLGQMVCIPYVAPTIVQVEELPPTGRGDGGFGSTGR